MHSILVSYHHRLGLCIYAVVTCACVYVGAYVCICVCMCVYAFDASYHRRLGLCIYTVIACMCVCVLCVCYSDCEYIGVCMSICVRVHVRVY
jgi:hypothetical protein